jgi:hypothetical protein
VGCAGSHLGASPALDGPLAGLLRRLPLLHPPHGGAGDGSLQGAALVRGGGPGVAELWRQVVRQGDAEHGLQQGGARGQHRPAPLL